MGLVRQAQAENPIHVAVPSSWNTTSQLSDELKARIESLCKQPVTLKRVPSPAAVFTRAIANPNAQNSKYQLALGIHASLFDLKTQHEQLTVYAESPMGILSKRPLDPNAPVTLLVANPITSETGSLFLLAHDQIDRKRHKVQHLPSWSAAYQVFLRSNPNGIGFWTFHSSLKPIQEAFPEAVIVQGLIDRSIVYREAVWVESNLKRKCLKNPTEWILSQAFQSRIEANLYLDPARRFRSSETQERNQELHENLLAKRGQYRKEEIRRNWSQFLSLFPFGF